MKNHKPEEQEGGNMAAQAAFLGVAGGVTLWRLLRQVYARKLSEIVSAVSQQIAPANSPSAHMLQRLDRVCFAHNQL